MKSTNYYAPHYVIFSSPTLGLNIFLSTLLSKILFSSLAVKDQVSHPYKQQVKL
jgi:hypothetical protein